MSFTQNLKNVYMNFRGNTTNRKIVAFESDDWGSVRMQSLDAFNFLKSNRELSIL